MRFLAFALFVVAAATCSLAASVEELINSAKEAGAPFTSTALTRLHDSKLWGAKRANRSSDVVIINGSKQPFKLHKSHCTQGALSKGLLPEDDLNDRSSIVYGLQSSNDVGDVFCTIEYKSAVNEHSWFSMMIHVPFHGDNVAYAFSFWDLKITPVVGAGNNNQITFTVKDALSPHGARLSQTGGLPSRKLSGKRNKFVKTSKSGSRSRRI